MTAACSWQLPRGLLSHLSQAPANQPVALLLRHSVRDALPPGDAGYSLPITAEGWGLAETLGKLLGARMKSLHSSPLVRCLQTAEAMRLGAGADMPIRRDQLLGDPGVFVLDGQTAAGNWERLGQDSVMQHLLFGTEALPGMARPAEAANLLLQHMLATTDAISGIHVFVSHDMVLAPAATRLLGESVSGSVWPWFLEGALFWREHRTVTTAYRGKTARFPHARFAQLSNRDVTEFAHRELNRTVGNACRAHFFFTGGAFKTILTGRPPRDLDLWATTLAERDELIATLLRRGAQRVEGHMFAETFSINGRLIDVPRQLSQGSLIDHLNSCDIAIAAVGVEHRPGLPLVASIHPLAIESVRRREVLLLKPLSNWKYALTTLERMRRYALELGFRSGQNEEHEIWNVLSAQTSGERLKMIDRYRRTGRGEHGVMRDVLARLPDVNEALASPRTLTPSSQIAGT